jgi:hypothetical protein
LAAFDLRMSLFFEHLSSGLNANADIKLRMSLFSCNIFNSWGKDTIVIASRRNRLYAARGAATIIKGPK